MKKARIHLAVISMAAAAICTRIAVEIFYIQAQATPIVSTKGAKQLDKPGLWQSSVQWRQPESGKHGIYTFRVYCPTGMMRDVTGGKWGSAAPLAAMEGAGYPTGIPTAAYKQACK
ncbi:hypothetical protein [Synechococcus sp. CB0205]|uniref:hypothetical protein n=1 Tax=Synechococcus sp. CB0205 TaxID=232363 RepID=UPI0012EACC1E|nr:hypothetical protein [Synechococcus sp. CB0205]